MYGDMPSTAIFGAGPGTYSSRAWQTFAKAGSTSQSNVAGAYALTLTGGEIYSTDVSDKYVRPQIQRGEIVEGSRAVSQPYSSYTALLAEVGVIGFAIIVSIYLAALVRAWWVARTAIARAGVSDQLPAVAIASFIAFLTLLQMAVLENWLEVARATFVVWILFGVTCKEFDARRAQ
jgi:hypothetical protein